MPFNFEDILGKNVDELKLGEQATFSKTITGADVTMFCGVVGDFNPLLVNDRYARMSRYKQRLAPGMLIASLISNVLGTQLPGPGVVYAYQSLDFVAPVFIGDTITATVEVAEINREKNRVKMSTYCTNQFNERILVGEALVLPPPKK